MKNNKTSSIEYIDSNSKTILDVSHKIWEFAELSLKEFNSSSYYVGKLKEYGFEVEESLCGISTAFCGKFGSGRPYVGVLAEFDALSGLSQKAFSAEREELVPNGSGHGCGHNMLGAASLGAVLGIKAFLEKEGCSGTVLFYGCPGEEGGASKALLAREGVWKDLDAAITWHPGDTNEVSAGTCNSCVQTIYQFKGIAAHAAGCPELGRSALDAAELLNVGVQFLREHARPDARFHYSFLNAGGPSPNVVQPTADVLYMIRSTRVKDVLALEKRIDKIAEGAAMMTETEVNKIFVDGCSNTVPNSVLQTVLFKNMELIGVPTYDDSELSFASKLKASYTNDDSVPGAGAQHDSAIKAKVKELTCNGTKVMNDFLYPYYDGDHFSPGSTDVGDVSWLTPTAQFDAVAWPSGCPGHSWQNVSCANSPIGDKAVIFAAKVLCASAADLFTDISLIDKAKAEFMEKTEEGYFCPVPEGASLYVV